MAYLVLVAAFLFFAFIAPAKLTGAALVMLFVIAATVKFSARLIANVDAPFGDAIKAVGFAFSFLALALFTQVSFLLGTQTSISGHASLVVLAAFFVAYAAGFRLGLGTTLAASSLIALVSTLISGGLLFALTKVY